MYDILQISIVPTLERIVPTLERIVPTLERIVPTLCVGTGITAALRRFTD